MISGANTSYNTIAGNLIGTDPDGRLADGNRASGISIDNGASYNVIGSKDPRRVNVISGNHASGIYVLGATITGTQIIGSMIGTDVSGLNALGNDHVGIIIQRARGTRIGGTLLAERVVVAGNNQPGIVLADDTMFTRILGNLVGVDTSGARPLANGSGIDVFLAATDNEIARNIVSGNRGAGIILRGARSTRNRIHHNHIGTDATSTLDLGNELAGVAIELGSAGNVVESNVVRHNGSAIAFGGGNHVVANDFTANRDNTAWITGSTTADTTWDVQGELRTYVVLDDDLVIPKGRSLTMGPGVDVLFDFGRRIRVEGTLESRGTATAPVTFGAAALYGHPLPGDWAGLTFVDGASGRLTGSHVAFAASGIDVQGGDVRLVDSTVTASAYDGVRVRNGTLRLTRVSLAGNGVATGGAGLRNDTATTIDATGAWWGSADGPRTASRPSATGDSVAGPVRIDDWQTTPPWPSRAAPNPWAFAPVLNPGTHAGISTIAEGRDFRWFRVPVGTRGAAITATLEGLPTDYDLFMFHGLARGPSSPEGIGPTSPEGIGPTSPEGIGPGELPGAVSSGVDDERPCLVGYLGEIVRLGMAANTGQMVASSCRFGAAAERVTTATWDQSGWYHVLVAPHNGTRAPGNPFDLRIDVRAGKPAGMAGFEPSSIDVPEVEADARTLVVWPKSRLIARFGRDRVLALDAAVQALAGHPNVNARIVEVDLVPAVAAAYQSWDAEPENPVRANIAAAAVRAALLAYATATPALEHIVLIGDDDAIPFHRVPDETLLSNERTYATAAFAASAPRLAAGLRDGYFLSDDPYASVAPLPYRGRSLPQPAYGLGRLVETPEDITQAIDAFMSHPIVEATGGLVTGYDFLTDMSNAIASRLEARGLGGDAVARMIDDLWTPDHFLRAWRDGRPALLSLNAHFTHRAAEAAQPARNGSRSILPADLAFGGALAQRLVFTVGCHSGLSVPAGPADAQHEDFAQVTVAGGATYVANTGFGYGDADTIAYSERLMTLFVEHVTRGRSTGQALRMAKADYLNGLGLQSLTPYDEKVLGIATLYGLPMVEVRLPAPQAPLATQRSAPRGRAGGDQGGQLGTLGSCPQAAAVRCRIAAIALTYDGPIHPGGQVAGAYFQLTGESSALPGRPIHARTSISVSLPGVAARGAFLDGGRYRTLAPFDPVIARVVTDTTAIPLWQTEPRFDRPGWTRTQWALINTIGSMAGLRQRLVLTPEQYRPLDKQTGVLRQLEAITYTLYYSNHADSLPPSVWSVQASMGRDDATAELSIDATDFSDVIRVAVTYTDGNGRWRTNDLTRNAEDRWIGTLPAIRGLEYFVQAVDGAGNVGVNDNKGRYFALRQPQVMLPLVGQPAVGP